MDCALTADLLARPESGCHLRIELHGCLLGRLLLRMSSIRPLLHPLLERITHQRVYDIGDVIPWQLLALLSTWQCIDDGLVVGAVADYIFDC